jgi:hypothetical protein
MKIAIPFLLLPIVAHGISCGNTLTKACLGETDKRYDPKSSNALKDQAEVYTISEGYYSCLVYFYDGATGLPLIGTNPYGTGGSLFPRSTFYNLTFDESRLYSHRINIYEGLDEGGTGNSIPTDGWYTSTYEKDGTGASIGAQFGYGGDAFQPTEDSTLLLYPIDDRSSYASGQSNTEAGPKFFYTEVHVCLDESCSQLSINEDTFFDTGNGTIRYSQSVWNCDKIDSGEAWTQAIEEAYDTYKVPEDMQVTVPMVGKCFTGACPSEEQWCVTDPDCSRSPYQEPDASVEGGAIAGFTIAGIVLLIAVLYGLHVWRTKQQAKRYKTMFAMRIADTIDVRASMRLLSPEALAVEFKKIDSESPNGNISKEALWTFLSTGKAGDLSESDFNALFAAIDLDQSGTVDFLEFCTFMGKCSDEYRSARTNRGSVADRVSRRISVADVTARRLSSVGPGTDDAMKAAAASAAAMPEELEEVEAEDAMDAAVALEEGEPENIDE